MMAQALIKQMNVSNNSFHLLRDRLLAEFSETESMIETLQTVLNKLYLRRDSLVGELETAYKDRFARPVYQAPKEERPLYQAIKQDSPVVSTRELRHLPSDAGVDVSEAELEAMFEASSAATEPQVEAPRQEALAQEAPKPPAISEEQMAPFLRRLIAGDSVPGPCSLCSSKMALGVIIAELPCDHMFHGICAKKWFHDSALCPKCSRDCTPLRPEEMLPAAGPEEMLGETAVETAFPGGRKTAADLEGAQQ